MDQQAWKKIDRIVDKALPMEQRERQQYIKEACEDDEELKSQVTELLASIFESDTMGFLEDEAHQQKNIFNDFIKDPKGETASSLINTQVGRYNILELIGHGGMGSVFLAERMDKAYEQKVALKILRRGMDTPANIARFKRERNILARLNHPQIATLLDGGVTDEGLPYLVMEYIDGVTLYEYCNTHHLTIVARLDMFRSVCAAVQHAHKNAVIHRDLKPSNILITEDEQVKILDFGIAKIMDPEEINTTIFQTETGARLLTLGYAAPEQTEGSAITTATDSYTLGILLYELLTGIHPYDAADKSLTEFERIIREETPDYPAKAFQKLSQGKKQDIAQKHGTTSSSLLKQLEGDLNAIVIKALRKEPDRRYTTVQALLADLKRHQGGRPVGARSDTWRYRTEKFIKRHRWSVGVAATALVLVAGFIVAMGWQIEKTTRERDRAVAISSFMKNILSISDPEKGQGGAMPVRVLLEKGATDLDSSFRDEPIMKAELQEVIGSAFRGYGLYKEALRLHRKALALLLAENGPKSLAVADSRNNIGEVFYYLGQQDSAADYYQESLRVRRRLLGDDRVKIAQSLNNLALIDLFHEDYAHAAKRMKRALAIFRDRLPPDHWRIANVLNNLAAIRSNQGQLQKAERLYRQSLAMHLRINGENHRDVARSGSSLGSVFIKEGKLTQADTTLTQALRRARTSTTNNLPIIGEILINLGRIRLHRGDYAEAERYFRKAHAEYLKALPAHHHKQANALLQLGRALLAQGHTAQALASARKAVTIDENALPPGQQRTAEAQSFLAAALTANKQYEEAEQQLQKSCETLRHLKSSPAKHTLRKAYERFSQLYKVWGKPKLETAYSDTLANLKKVNSGSRR